jgi:hypothetical protein
MEELRSRYPECVTKDNTCTCCMPHLPSTRPSTASRDAVGSSNVESFAAPQGATGSSFAAIIDLTGDNDSSLERWLDANFPDCSDEEF